MNEECGSDAAYVLGALSPADRQAYERHLRDCQECQDSVQRLAGLPGLLALTSAYGDGLDCEQGMRRALGQPLTQIEADWRASALGENAGWTAFTNLFPYIAILVVLLLVSMINAFTFKKVQDDE